MGKVKYRKYLKDYFIFKFHASNLTRFNYIEILAFLESYLYMCDTGKIIIVLSDILKYQDFSVGHCSLLEEMTNLNMPTCSQEAEI